jgi:hypothetical protein
MKKVVIYPGRFQPMLPHHAEVYTRLQAQFPGSEVYVATSNKVEGSKSPFNFEEKKSIITEMHGIPEDRIILAANPYLIDSYMKEFDQKNTMVIFAVGGKDEDRFPMRNIDDSTGLNMAVRGETRPTYYQMINTLKQHPALPMSDRGYIHITPTVAGMGEVASASAFRNAFTSVEDTEKRKEVFQKYMGTYNETMFNLFKNKLIGEKMSEQLEIMKYLAGLLKEAPINFDADIDTGMSDEEDDEYATKPGYTQDNMINQLGKIIDSDDAGKEVDQMKIKKFTPVTKVTTDDNGSVDVSPAEAKALKSMMDMLSSARMGEEQSPREKFLDAIQTKKGLLNMIDFAYDKKVVQKLESFVAPDMNLDDIREDYDVRQDCHSKTHDCATKVIHPTWGEGKPMYESHAVPTDEGYVAWYDVEFAHGIEKEVPAQDMEIITLAEHGVNASKKSKGLKNVLMAGRLKDVIIDAMSMDKAEFDAQYKGDFDWNEINKEYNDQHPDFQEQPEPDMEESAPFGEPSQEEEMYNKLITAYENSEEDLAEVMGMSMQELDQEMTEFAMEHRLHMDDDRDEVVQGYIEQVCDNAEYKDHGEPEMAQEHIDALEELKKMAGLDSAR